MTMPDAHRPDPQHPPTESGRIVESPDAVLVPRDYSSFGKAFDGTPGWAESMNTQTDSKPAARPPALALEYRPTSLSLSAPENEPRRSQGAIVPAYAEPSAEIVYGCVEWFRYDKHENPLGESSGSGKKRG